MPDEGDCSLSLLAEGLRGSPRAASPERARALAAAALRPAPTVSVGPIIHHLERLVGALVEASAAPEPPLAADADSVRELTFALASTLGTARLEASEEEAVWQIAADLWVGVVPVAFLLQPLPRCPRPLALPHRFIHFCNHTERQCDSGRCSRTTEGIRAAA